jgi:hypothetical protein
MATRKREANEAINITRKKSRGQWPIAPKVVLAFVSENHEYLPSIENFGDFTIEEDILRVRLVLWKNKGRCKKYAEKAKHISSLSEQTLIAILKDSKKAKYRGRESPPFPANTLCGSTIKGYTSVKNSKGVCTWISKL